MIGGDEAAAAMLILTHLPLQAAGEVSPGDFSLPLPMALAVVGVVGTMFGAYINAVSKKWRTPADAIAEKKVNVEADDKLLQRFENLLALRDTRIDLLDDRIVALNDRIDGMKEEKNELLDFIYVLVRIIRNADLLGEIPVPAPAAVHILGIRGKGEPDPRPK